MDLFSSRRRAVTAKAEELIAAFEAPYGRAPTPAERSHIAQQATLATRAGKSHDGETRAEQLARWTAQCRRPTSPAAWPRSPATSSPAPSRPQPAAELVAARRHRAGRSPRCRTPSRRGHRSDLIRAISDALPGNLGIAPEQVAAAARRAHRRRRWQHAMPRHRGRRHRRTCPRRSCVANGESPYTAPGRRAYTTDGPVRRRARRPRGRRGRAAPRRSPPSQADRLPRRAAPSPASSSASTRPPPCAACSPPARGSRCCRPPPGTGKSFVVGAHRRRLDRPAPPATRTRRGGGCSGSPPPRSPPSPRRRRPDRRATSPPGSPPSTGSTAAAAASTRRADGRAVAAAPRRPGRGRRGRHDRHRRTSPRSSARCAGRGREAAAGRRPPPARPRSAPAAAGRRRRARHRATSSPRPAGSPTTGSAPPSLRLRDGDATVLDEYAKHGRLLDGGTAEQAEAAAARAWLADTLAGRESLLLVDTNEQPPASRRSCAPSWSRSAGSTSTGVPLGTPGLGGHRRRGRRPRPGPRATAGTWPAIRGQHRAPRSTARPTGSPRSRRRRPHRRPDRRRRSADDRRRWNVWGERLGEPMQLPGVLRRRAPLARLRLHRARRQGRTVDTGHAVIGAGTDLAGLLRADDPRPGRQHRLRRHHRRSPTTPRPGRR